MSKYKDKLTVDKFGMKDRSKSYLRIYVGGLTETVTADDLYENFISCGQVTGIVVNRNFGFIQFENESSVQEAISQKHGTLFQGKMLVVRPAQAERLRNREPDVKVPSENLPVVASKDNYVKPAEEGSEEPYDNFGNYIGDGFSKGWEEGRQTNEPLEPRGGMFVRGGPRGRGPGRGGPSVNYRDHTLSAGRGFAWQERNTDRFSQQITDYRRNIPITERNDCEIIVVSKELRPYAEYIEDRLKRLGIVVDLLFPMEDVPIGKVLGNIASRGCYYAILVTPQNQEHKSLSLTILHGLPQEHRNMPLEDALQLLSRNFQEVRHGGSSGREAVYALLGQLADGRSLTVLQYDKVIEYLQDRREHQIKLELGEPVTPATTNSKIQAELEQKIMSILNEKTIASFREPTPPTAVTPTLEAQHKLLSDPALKKALDFISQKFI